MITARNARFIRTLTFDPLPDRARGRKSVAKTVALRFFLAVLDSAVTFAADYTVSL